MVTPNVSKGCRRKRVVIQPDGFREIREPAERPRESAPPESSSRYPREIALLILTARSFSEAGDSCSPARLKCASGQPSGRGMARPPPPSRRRRQRPPGPGLPPHARAASSSPGGDHEGRTEIASAVRSMCASTSGSRLCCSAAVASSENDGTAASASGSCCATAADPGGAAHSDKNLNAPSGSGAIYHEIITEPLTPPTPC